MINKAFIKHNHGIFFQCKLIDVCIYILYIEVFKNEAISFKSQGFPYLLKP